MTTPIDTKATPTGVTPQAKEPGSPTDLREHGRGINEARSYSINASILLI
jgi:hypothetical protein